jgi:hypothetical protein
MRYRKVVHQPIRHESGGVNIAGDINATIAANFNEPGSNTVVSESHVSIVQDSRRKATQGDGPSNGNPAEPQSEAPKEVAE